MKLSKLTTLLLTLFVVGCDSISSTTSSSGTTSFVEDSSEITNSNNLIEINNDVSLSSLNGEGFDGITPSTGDVNVLLIPIHFPDIDENILDVSLIDKAFNGKDEDILWYSVSQYYNISSYGKLNLSFEITDVFNVDNPSYHFTNQYNNSNYPNAVSQDIIVSALNYFDDIYDYSNFDSNNDGYIDAIYLIYDAPIDYTYQNLLWWAWTSYNFNESIVFDNVKYKSFSFAGFEFLKQDNQTCNTHTFIHETAHLFGIDDHYDYDNTKGTNKGGLAKADMMDGTIGDHNAFTKSLLNWNKGKLVSINDENTPFVVELEAFSENGDYLILANDFDMDKGILQEYFIIEYYTVSKLNELDKMFSINGIRVLHVNATVNKKTGVFNYNNSTTNFKLISQITTESGLTYISNTTERSDDTLFIENESLKSVNLSTGEYLSYYFSVDKLDDLKATLTIHKKKI